MSGVTRWSAVLLLAFLFSACTKPIGSSGSGGSRPQNQPPNSDSNRSRSGDPQSGEDVSPTVAKFELKLRTLPLRCGDVCPTGVGLVVIEKNSEVSRKYGQCVGTLIGPDTVITNSHCLPPEVKSGHESCSGRVGFVLPGSQDVSSCTEILTSSTVVSGQDSPDFAVFRLRKNLPEPRRVSRDGFQDGGKYDVYTIDPLIRTSISGILRKKTCLSLRGSLVAPTSMDDLSPVTSLFNCEFSEGNSGSPVVDQNGNLLGIVARREDKADLKLNGVSVIIPSAPANAVVTNLACVDQPSLDSKPNAGCSTRKSQSVTDRLNDKDFLMARVRWFSARVGGA